MKRDYVYIATLIVLSVLYFNSCSSKNESIKNFEQNISVLNDSLEFHKNKLGQEVAQKLAFKGSKKELQKLIDSKELENSQLKIALKKWKKVASATKVETKAEIKTVYIPFKKVIPCMFERQFKKVDKFYTIFGFVNNYGVNFQSISVPNTQTIISGQKKTGFFITEYRFEITNSNPYIKTTSADSYNFTTRNKRFGLGIIGGYGFSAAPGIFVGVGLSYDIWKF